MAADEERAPTRRGLASRRRTKDRGGWIAFLVASAIPVGALVFFFLQPEAKRQAVLDRFEGRGGAALAAGVAFGVMALLAWVALPAFHKTSSVLRGVLARIRTQKPLLRVLLFPVEFVVWLMWFLGQILFAVDAFLIIAAALIGLLLTIRIVVPDFLPGILTSLGGG